MSYSSSNTSSSYRGARKYTTTVERGVMCFCGIEAPCWEAKKDSTADPGRRFFGCSRFKDPKLACGFFKWADLPYTERAREVIEEMKMKLRQKADEASIYSEDLASAKKKMGELQQELIDMEIRLTYQLFEKDEQLMKMRKVFIIFIVAVCVLVLSLVCIN